MFYKIVVIVFICSTLIQLQILYYFTKSKSNEKPGKLKYVLYWNEAYGSKGELYLRSTKGYEVIVMVDYGFCCGTEPLKRIGCPVTNCHFTFDRDLLDHQEDWDAVWFGSRSLPEQPHHYSMPQNRSAHQKYIFWELESPAYLESFHPENYGGFFNWTVTYRQDSTAGVQYGRFEQVKEHPLEDDLQRHIRGFGVKNQHLAANKPGEVAWMVSNCLTESNREGYVEELRKHINIDIFGSCYEGSKSCAKDVSNDCWDFIASSYKFYLSFENSLCKDYVTEKFWEPMKRKKIIPIVLGGSNYSSIAPLSSYIDVSAGGFAESPKELATLLKELSRNASKYSSYLWWTEHYEVRNSIEDRLQGFCDVCKMLNEENQQMTVIEDMYNWWVAEAQCLDPMDFKRDILSDVDEEEAESYEDIY